MFPALSGNIPVSSNSSRGTSVSGGGDLNWGRFSGSDNQSQPQLQQSQNPSKWKTEQQLMSNTTPSRELFMEGDKGQGQHKRKNKKRRTNGE